MATSGEGRWSKDEPVFCPVAGMSGVVEVVYDDDDDTWAWECPFCAGTHRGWVGE